MPAYDRNKLPTAKITLTFLKEDEQKARLLLFEIFSQEESENLQPSAMITELLRLFQKANLKLLDHFHQIEDEMFALATQLKLRFTVTIKEETFQFERPPFYDPDSGDKYKIPAKQDSKPEEGPYYMETTYSFEEFISTFLATFFSQPEDIRLKIIGDKEQFIKYSYSRLRSYLRKVPIKKQPKPYRKHQLIAALGVVFGLFPTLKEYQSTPTPYKYYGEYLVDLTKHFCKKIDILATQGTAKKIKRTREKK